VGIGSNIHQARLPRYDRGNVWSVEEWLNWLDLLEVQEAENQQHQRRLQELDGSTLKWLAH